MAQLNFDANTVEPNTAFDPLPAGKYLAVISGSEEKITKAGDGAYLELEITITEGEYKGRKVWDRLCLRHPNSKAVEIARGNLSAICRAVGVMRPNDSADLHNTTLLVKIGCRNREDTGELTNEVRGYEKAGSQFSAPGTESDVRHPVSDTQKPVDDNSPPWTRK